jgi:hypothetical protein
MKRKLGQVICGAVVFAKSAFQDTLSQKRIGMGQTSELAADVDPWTSWLFLSRADDMEFIRLQENLNHSLVYKNYAFPAP